MGYQEERAKTPNELADRVTKLEHEISLQKEVNKGVTEAITTLANALGMLTGLTQHKEMEPQGEEN